MPWNRLIWLKNFVLRTFVIAVIPLFLAFPARANGPEFLESYRDPLNPKHILAVFNTASPDGAYLLQSFDGGQIWKTVLGPKGNLVKMGGRQNFDEIVIHASSRADPQITVTYKAGADKIWKAQSNLQWKSIRKGLPPGVILRLLLTADRDIIFVIIQDMTDGRAQLFLSETGGASWQKVHDRLPFECQGWCDAYASPDGKVLVGSEGRANPKGYISRDRGKNWNLIPPNQKDKEFSAFERKEYGVWPITGTATQKEAAFRAIMSGDPTKKRAKELEEEFEKARKHKK